MSTHDWKQPTPTLRICRACGRRERWRWRKGWTEDLRGRAECVPAVDDPGLTIGPGDTIVITVGFRPTPPTPTPEPAPAAEPVDDWALLAPWLAALPKDLREDATDG